MKLKYFPTILKFGSLLGIISMVACSPQAQTPNPSEASGQNMCTKRSYPEIGADFKLTDTLGNSVTQGDIAGQANLLFFGFTNCPDICPATLVRLKNAYRQLPDNFETPKTIFISVDPARDTPELLARYLSISAFPDNTIGLTGSEADIRAVAEGFFADYSRIDMPESLSEYTMDHTTLIYVLDENWVLKTFFTHQDTDADIANCLVELFN